MVPLTTRAGESDNPPVGITFYVRAAVSSPEIRGIGAH